MPWKLAAVCAPDTEKTVTIDGRKLKLYANIGSVSDVGYVLENDVEGIGLFRVTMLENISVMHLMITPVEEIQEIFRAVKEIRED